MIRMMTRRLTKEILACLLAGTLCLTLVTSAFAKKPTPQDGDVSAQSITIWIQQFYYELQATNPWLAQRVQVTTHAAERAISRNITPQVAARVTAWGIKYRDTWTNARVLWKDYVAVIVDQYYPKIVTIYDGGVKYWRWILENWSW